MTTAEVHAEHATVVDAPPSAVYSLITDVATWPVIFPPTVYTRVLERSAEGDRFEIWATGSAGEVNTWRSRRDFDAAAGRVTFAQDHGNGLFGFMGGGWTCAPLTGGRTSVVLAHRYRPPAEQADAARRIARELELNGSAELEALRTVAVLPGGASRWLLTFTESMELAGAAAAARAFIWEADRWPDRLPHVADLDLVERPGGAQELTMVTRTAGGVAQSTRSVRVLLSDGSIAYKQTQPPRALLGHSGRWEFLTGRSGSAIHSTHTFLLDPANVAEAFGDSTTADEAVDRVRAGLASHSRVTMEHASGYSKRMGGTR